MAEADLLVILTDCDGLMTADPRENPDAELIREVQRVDDAVEKLAAAGADGWVVMTSGSMVTATYLASVRGREERLTFAILCESDEGYRDRSSVRRSDASV